MGMTFTKQHTDETRQHLSEQMKEVWVERRKTHAPKNGYGTCEGCGERFVFVSKREVGYRKFCTRACREKNRPGRFTNHNGYVLIATSPGKYEFEHRVLMARHLGRPLTKRERVHHLNGDRADNRIENLELWTHDHPSGVRAGETTHCPTCTCQVQITQS